MRRLLISAMVCGQLELINAFIKAFLPSMTRMLPANSMDKQQKSAFFDSLGR
jgi:hypothetical protein